MKVTIIGQEPIYIDDEQGERLKLAIMRGVERVVINGDMYKASVITAVTHEEAPKVRNWLLEAGPVVKHERARLDSIAIKRFKQRRQQMGI